MGHQHGVGGLLTGLLRERSSPSRRHGGAEIGCLHADLSTATGRWVRGLWAVL